MVTSTAPLFSSICTSVTAPSLTFKEADTARTNCTCLAASSVTVMGNFTFISNVNPGTDSSPGFSRRLRPVPTCMPAFSRGPKWSRSPAFSRGCLPLGPIGSSCCTKDTRCRAARSLSASNKRSNDCRWRCFCAKSLLQVPPRLIWRRRRLSHACLNGCSPRSLPAAELGCPRPRAPLGCIASTNGVGRPSAIICVVTGERPSHAPHNRRASRPIALMSSPLPEPEWIL